MNKKKLNIYIAGHNGMVGSALLRILKRNSNYNLITKTKNELDLLDQSKVKLFFNKKKIDYVYLAAAKVGGIYANNKYPANFIYENLTIQNNIIHSAYENKIKRLLFLGSSCIYPKNIQQPMKESFLLNGKLEMTNEPYAIAKIAGIKMCESYNRQYRYLDFRSIMPSNLYGPGDNYHPKNSHVIPGLINRFHNAKIKNHSKVSVWGSGKVKREFLFVDDMASAAIHVMDMKKSLYRSITESYQSHINVGSGADITISSLAKKISDVIGYKGKIIFDKKYPDGVKQKLLDSSLIKNSKWYPKTTLDEGINLAYNEYLKNLDN